MNKRKPQSTEAAAFRARLELLMEQMARDPEAPAEIAMAMPFLLSQMSGVSDKKLLDLREFLKSVVGED
jgi:hypothetical protein